MKTETKIVTLRFTYGTSRAAGIEGYNVASLYVDGKLAGRCNGGGYDMQGTCFGEWLSKTFGARIDRSRAIQRKAKAGDLYGLSYWNPDVTADPGERHSKHRTRKHTRRSINGGCGFTSMCRIFEAVGGTLRKVKGTRREDIFLATFPVPVQD